MYVCDHTQPTNGCPCCGHLLFELKSGEELLKDALSSGENWTSEKNDPKADLTEMILNTMPMARASLLDSFDPEGKVWTVEEQVNIINAPPPELDPDDFKPITITLPKEMRDYIKKKTLERF